MSYLKTILGFLVVFVFVSSFYSKQTKYPFSKAELEEFELLNLCHCFEYLEMRDLDYIEFHSKEAKEKYIDNLDNAITYRYVTRNVYTQYYQEKFDNTVFFKNGYSKRLESKLDFSRLDSLFYEPIVQRYAEIESQTEVLPYLGLGDHSDFFDCYYKVKEIQLEEEYALFLIMNKQFKD